MPFLLLLIMTLACLPEQWPQPLAWFCIAGSVELSTALTVVSMLFAVCLAASMAHEARFQILEQPERRDLIFYHHTLWRRRLFISIALLLLAQVYVFGWGWSVQQLCTLSSGLMVPAAELLVLVPFLLALLITWGLFYETDHAMQQTMPQADLGSLFRSRRTYVLFQLQQNLAIVAGPVILLATLKSLRRCYPETDNDRIVFEVFSFSLGVFEVVAYSLIGLMFICLPWLLRMFLGLKPLPPGPLRDRLLASARRLRFRFSNILLWNTHGCIGNAMIAGIFPWLRYVVFTDRLVNELSADEVEAVFGHEIGHVKHRHMFFYLGFLLISVAVVGGAWGLTMNLVFAAPPPQSVAAAADQTQPPTVSPAIPPHVPVNSHTKDLMGSYKDLEAVPVLTIAGAYIFVVFGFLSRRCERQADVYGCRAVSCLRHDCDGHDASVMLAPAGHGLCPTGIRTFIDALEKVARINGISRSRPGWLQSWQHSTIARRVEFLQRVLADPAVERRFQWTVFVVKWGLLLLLGGALWALRASVS